jgi:uncharacterized circularly permuted ATP-grasp superfamily protein
VKSQDELLCGTVARDGLAPLWNSVSRLGSEGLQQRARLRDNYLAVQGITFTLSGKERPLPIDLVPRVIKAAEWLTVESGVQQRVRAVEAFLADVHGEQRILADGVVPRELVTGSPLHLRAAYGVRPPNGVRVHVAGIDIVRDEHGELLVLEDNLRCPSGVSYVLENRRTLAHVVPEIFDSYAVRSVQEYPERLLESLLRSAPHGVRDPVVVVLTPGVFNSAHFEHAFLARRLGVELVEGRDLYCKGNRVFMRTTGGSSPVHVIYRRIDDEYLDPVQFRGDSILGVPGLLNAARAGHVAIANAVGNGVADDKVVFAFVPQMIEYYLRERPILRQVETFDLRDAATLERVLDDMENLVAKPATGSGGGGIMIGPRATREEIDAARDAVAREPRLWAVQPVVSLSTCPTVLDDGTLAPRHVDLRPFAVNNGDDVWVLPGGLTRVALVEGSLIVNSSQGGGSKDTWVLAANSQDWSQPIPRPVTAVRDVLNGDLPRDPGPDALPDTRLRQQMEQQQQQRGAAC